MRISKRPPLMRFGRSENGHAAIEFSLIGPVMIAMFFSCIEVTDGLMTNKHIVRATSALADLTARTRINGGVIHLQESELEDIFIASGEIVAGYGISGATMTVTAIERNEDNTDYIVVWSRRMAGGSNVVSMPEGEDYTPGGSFTRLGNNTVLDANASLLLPGDHMVVAEVQYTFRSSLSQIVYNPLNFDQMEIRLPREGQQIHLCTANGSCTDDEA